jgi:hypothetical protein
LCEKSRFTQNGTPAVSGSAGRERVHHRKLLADPEHNWHRHVVAKRLVALARSCTDGELFGSDVANLMEWLKIARRYSGWFNPDDYPDGAGYAGVAYEVRRGEIGD